MPFSFYELAYEPVIPFSIAQNLVVCFATSSDRSTSVVSSVYRPLNIEVKDFRSNFGNLLDYSCIEGKEGIILGDLN